jgi:hypothetical protein
MVCSGATAYPPEMHYYDDYSSYNSENPLTENPSFASTRIDKVNYYGGLGEEYVGFTGPTSSADFYFGHRFLTTDPGYFSGTYGIRYAQVDSETGERILDPNCSKLYFTNEFGAKDIESIKRLQIRFHSLPAASGFTFVLLEFTKANRLTSQAAPDWSGTYEIGDKFKVDTIIDFVTGYVEFYVDGELINSFIHEDIRDSMTNVRDFRYMSASQNAGTKSEILLDNTGYKIYDNTKTLDEIRDEIFPGTEELELNVTIDENDINVSSQVILGMTDANVIIATYGENNEMKGVSIQPYTSPKTFTAKFNRLGVTKVKTFLWDMNDDALIPLIPSIGTDVPIL